MGMGRRQTIWTLNPFFVQVLSNSVHSINRLILQKRKKWQFFFLEEVFIKALDKQSKKDKYTPRFLSINHYPVVCLGEFVTRKPNVQQLTQGMLQNSQNQQAASAFLAETL